MTLTPLVRTYRDIALVTLNTVLLGLAFLVACQAAIIVFDIPATSALKPEYSKEMDLGSFTLISQEDAIQTGRDFDRMGEQESFAFNPWTTFHERAFEGELVTVKPGVLSTSRGTTAPEPALSTVTSANPSKTVTIWTFGGSTMFGWGMPDSQTIPSHLWRELQRRFPQNTFAVTNYGHSYYWSSMEVSLYVALLRSESRPDIVIFLDGLNDCIFTGKGLVGPQFAAAANLAWERERERRFTGSPRWFRLESGFPPLRIYRYLTRSGTARVRSLYTANNPYARTIDNKAAEITRIYRLNRGMAEALSTRMGIRAYFFLQPVPWYGNEGAKRQPGAQEAYDALIAEAGERSTQSFMSLHDLLDHMPKPYVDRYHYSDRGCQAIATRMAEVIGAHPEVRD